MNSKIRQLYTLAFVLVLTFVAVSLYGVSLALTWARDLPNRIVIEEEALSVAFGSFVTESYHAVFRDGDPATQTQVLTEQFLPMITDNQAGRNWVRDEYRDDLLRLASSSDATVSSAASEVLAVLDRSSDPPSSPPRGELKRSAIKMMLYPDHTPVQAGDLIWWDEGHCVGFVQEVIESEADRRKWGLAHPHISIGSHPYEPAASGFVVYAASDFADEGIGRLTDDESVQLDAVIQHAQGEAGLDLSAIGFVVQAEVRDGIQAAWLITANPPDAGSGTIRIPVDVVDGTQPKMQNHRVNRRTRAERFGR